MATQSLRERQANKAAAIDLEDDVPIVATTARAEPRTAPGQLMNLQGKYANALEEVKRLEDELRTATPSEILISELHEVAGRRRKLTTVQYAELKDNLRLNPLISPISVRKAIGGGFEVISGHNRLQVFRELGREKILAVVIESDDDQAELSAFYANLLQPNLPDFEKYIGFSEIARRQPQLTRSDIARNAGVDKSTITQLMSFGNLPAEAIAILTLRPEIIGANAAQDLAKLSAKGLGERVIEALNKIVSGEFDQAQAVKFAASDFPNRPKSARDEPVRIKAGKSGYCELRQADKILRIEFKSLDDATAAKEAITAVLQRFANEKSM